MHRIAALLLLALPAAGVAQEVAPVPPLPARPAPVERDAGAPRAGVWLSGARHSNLPSAVEQATRDFVALGLRRAWPLGGTRFVAIDYVADLIPVALSSAIREYRDVATPCPGGGPCLLALRRVPVTGTAYGVGLAPLGVQVRLARGRAVQGLVEVSGGALWFTHPLPDSLGTRFNFTAQVGAGLQLRVARHTALVARYGYHHTSNAGTGAVNPGLNAFVVTLGMMRTH